MPEATATSHGIGTRILQPPIYMTSGPIGVLYYPCTCGNASCLRPVVVHSYQVHSSGAAPPYDPANYMLPGNAELGIPNIPDPNALPPNSRHQQVANDFAANYYVAPEYECGPLVYPSYPEDQPRQSRRQSRRQHRRRRRQRIETHLIRDSDDESEVDR